jgi:hypothetical protein
MRPIREKQGRARSLSPPTAQARNELASAERDTVARRRSRAIVGAIAGDPARWSRANRERRRRRARTRLRDWLTQLDAAARGRWQRSADADDRTHGADGRDAATRLRRPHAAVVSSTARPSASTPSIAASAGRRRCRRPSPNSCAPPADRLGP